MPEAVNKLGRIISNEFIALGDPPDSCPMSDLDVEGEEHAAAEVY